LKHPQEILNQEGTNKVPRQAAGKNPTPTRPPPKERKAGQRERAIKQPARFRNKPEQAAAGAQPKRPTPPSRKLSQRQEVRIRQTQFIPSVT